GKGGGAFPGGAGAREPGAGAAADSGAGGGPHQASFGASTRSADVGVRSCSPLSPAPSTGQSPSEETHNVLQAHRRRQPSGTARSLAGPGNRPPLDCSSRCSMTFRNQMSSIGAPSTTIIAARTPSDGEPGG